MWLAEKEPEEYLGNIPKRPRERYLNHIKVKFFQMSIKRIYQNIGKGDQDLG